MEIYSWNSHNFENILYLNNHTDFTIQLGNLERVAAEYTIIFYISRTCMLFTTYTPL